MSRQILVLGATGMLGRPVVRCLADQGHRVRVLVRSIEKAHQILGDTVEVVEGSVLEKDNIQAAMGGCEAVHINLTQDTELTAMGHVVDLAADSGVERVSYVSATTAREENRWFNVVDVKMRTEAILRSSGIASVIFCPTCGSWKRCPTSYTAVGQP
ncbi:MAG: hypothetical protein CMJ49_13105 [Planctomycetaceae bacterium]|nr:hypothetical protein [Planctomycetaceae bacterium]